MVWLKIDQPGAMGYINASKIISVGVKRKTISPFFPDVECTGICIKIEGEYDSLAIFETNVNGFAEKLAEALTWEIIFSRDNKDILDFNKMFLALFKAIYKEDVEDGESRKE